MDALALSLDLQKPLWVGLTERAGRDAAFRRRLLDQPTEVLGEVMGERLAPSIKVAVHENSASHINVVLDPFALSQLQESIEKGDPVAALVRRAADEPEFRQRLVDEPEETVLRTTGVQLPPGTKVSVHENNSGELHLLLPQIPGEDGELSDAELEAVAGGRGPRGRRAVCNTVSGAAVAGCVGASIYTWGAAAGYSGGGVSGAVAYSGMRK